MLDLFKSFCSRFCFIAKIIYLSSFSTYIISPIYGASYSIQEISPKEYQWIEQYLDCVNKSSSPKEWIHFLFKLKKFLDNKGYKSSSLMEMARIYRNELESHGVTINEKDFNYLTNLICGKSNNFILSKYHSKKQKEEAKVPAGLVIGFVKCLAGGLLCIIPAPVAQGIGIGLIVSGIDDCLDEVKKQSEINERQNEQSNGGGSTWGYTF